MMKTLIAVFLLCFIGSASAGTYQIACTTATATVSAARNSRKILMVINQGAAAVIVCYAPTCTTGTGIQLQPDAALTDPFNRAAVSCITASSSTTLGVVEE